MADVPDEETTERVPELPDEERINRIRKYSMSLDGEDPEMQQSINKFMKMDNPIERSNFPRFEDVDYISYLEYTGMRYFPDEPHNPFQDLARTEATAFMAKGGMKSEQVVRILQKGIDLAELRTTGEPEKSGILDRIRGRGRPEE